MRLGPGLESIPSFQVGQTEYEISAVAPGLGVDVGLTEAISVGLHHNYISTTSADARDVQSGFSNEFQHTLNHTILRARVSTDQWRLFSVYFSTGLHRLAYDYPDFSLNRKALGFSGGAGIVMRLRRLRINIAELNVIRLNNHLFSDTVDSKVYLHLKAGIAIRIIEPL